jgi:tetratricopeptide (TPR) repeat protein
MKFTRRPDLDPHTRIEIVRRAWLYQGVYGKMTHIAHYYQISRTFLYQLIFLANLQLEMLFSDAKLLLQKDHQHFEQLLLLLRLEGNCALLSMSSILKALEYHPNSVGYLSQFFQSVGQTLPSTLLMPSTTWVFYLSDEIFAIHTPILVTIDARSTTILNIERAADRSAETWKAHFEALAHHHCVSLGMASDRGLGLVAGYQAACDMALWVADYFHEFQDLFALLYQLERKAYAAMNKEYDAARTFAHAKSEANLHKRLQQYETAHDACEQAVTLYDQLDVLLHLLREAFHVCSPHGKLRTQENVRSELMLLFDMIGALDCTALPPILKPIGKHIDDLLVPFQHVEVIAAELQAVVPHEALDFLVLAWHHNHLSYQAGAKQKRYHQREQAFCLACADGLLGDAFDTLNVRVFDKLDSIVRASSLVEMVNSLLRPYLNSCKGQITPETLNLIMFYHNHRRYKSGKRQGKAPIELLTGKPLQAPWWELLLQQVKTKQGVTSGALPSRPPLHLVIHTDGETNQQAMAPGQAIVEPMGASEKNRRQTDAEAA